MRSPHTQPNSLYTINVYLVLGGEKIEEDIMEGDFLSDDYKPGGHPRKAFFDLLNRILDKCEVEETFGSFKCKNCGAFIEIDWFDKEVTCACDTI